MERITGTINLLNNDGECCRRIDVSTGNAKTTEGTFGSLIVDMNKRPPLVQGKGNVWINRGEKLTRTVRLEGPSAAAIAISSNGHDRGTSIGYIALSTSEPEPDPESVRASGNCRCSLCDQEYRRHPNYEHRNDLTILCDGGLVKL